MWGRNDASQESPRESARARQGSEEDRRGCVRSRLVGLGLPKDRDPLTAERLTNPDKQKIRKAVDEVIARDREAGGMSYVDARRRYLEHFASPWSTASRRCEPWRFGASCPKA